LAWAVAGVAPDTFAEQRGLAALTIAVPYLAAGYGRRHPPFALVGAGALLIATLQHWSGVEGSAVLLGLAMLWAALDHPLDRADGRWYALVTLGIALVQLLDLASQRGFDDTAFVGRWARVLWLGVAVTAALAKGLWRRQPDTAASRLAPPVLWVG